MSNSGRTEEIRVLKLWRRQKGIEFPSFYLELTVINALSGRRSGELAANVWTAFAYLRGRVRSPYPGARRWSMRSIMAIRIHASLVAGSAS